MLADETLKVWEVLKDNPLLDGFVLVGGTALSLHIHHRISEDLDFAYTGINLPRKRLDRLIQIGESLGLTIDRNDDPASLEDFLDAGLELWDSQQDLVVNHAVKVSFFVPSRSTMSVVSHYGRRGIPQVASVEEIFMTKALVVANRSKTRDWFDLYVLMNKHGFDAKDFVKAFMANDAKLQIDSALTRLSLCRPDAGDESYLAVVADPPSLEQIREYFSKFRDEVECLIGAGFR